MTPQPGDQCAVTIEGSVHHWRREHVVAAFVAQTTAQAEQRRVLFDFAGDVFLFKPDAHIRVLDRFPNATAVGLDLSEPMMAVGRERMARFGDRFAYHVGDLSAGKLPCDLPGQFDLAVSSAFLLRLPTKAKQRLYTEVFRILNPGGCFVNVDQVAPSNDEMQDWYREWRERERQRHGDQPEPSNPHALMQHHHFEAETHARHHFAETEADQVAFLRAAGFVRVDCFYKRLLQTVIGGYKPG